LLCTICSRVHPKVCQGCYSSRPCFEWRRAPYSVTSPHGPVSRPMGSCVFRLFRTRRALRTLSTLKRVALDLSARAIFWRAELSHLLCLCPIFAFVRLQLCRLHFVRSRLFRNTFHPFCEFYIAAASWGCCHLETLLSLAARPIMTICPWISLNKRTAFCLLELIYTTFTPSPQQ
jgi:hypothetical protein